MQQINRSLLSILPRELIEMIILKLSPTDLGNLALSSTSLRNVCRSDIIWKELTLRNFPSSSLVGLSETWFQAFARLDECKKKEENVGDVTSAVLDHMLACDHHYTCNGVVWFTVPNIEMLQHHFKEYDELNDVFTFIKSYPDAPLMMRIYESSHRGFSLLIDFRDYLSEETSQTDIRKWRISDTITVELLNMLLTHSIQVQNDFNEDMLDYSNGTITLLKQDTSLYI